MIRNTKNVVILVSCVFILIIALMSIRFLPDSKNENNLKPDIPPVNILNELIDNIDNIKIINNYGEYDFVKNQENQLEIQDLKDKYKANKAFYEEFQDIISNFVAEKIIGLEDLNLETYGLIHPVAQIIIKRKDNTTSEILIGNQAPGEAGYYLTQVGKPQVYLISNEVADLFFRSKIDYISLSIISAESNQDSQDVLKNLEYIEFIGGTRPEKIKIIKTKSNKNKIIYKIIEPVKARVLENKNYIIESLENIVASKIEAIEITDEDIEECNLVHPFAELNLKYKNKSEINLVLSPVQDENSEDYFAMIKNSNIIYRVSKYNLEWIDILLDDLIKA